MPLPTDISRQQKSRALLKASLTTSLGAVLIVVLFSVWKERTNPKESAKAINQIESMESQGVPSFSAKTIEGSTISTADFKNKLVIINFWASWCEPCVAEVPSLLELIKAFPGQLELVAVSGDNSLDDIKAFLKSFPQMKNSSVHIIWDEDHAIMSKYGTQRLPESFVVGKDGKLVKKIVGSINWHTADSEGFIKELLAAH